jgi:hypothetical protein
MISRTTAAAGVVNDILDRGAPVAFEAGQRHVSSEWAATTQFTLTKIMGRLDGSRQIDLGQAQRVPCNARVRPTKMEKHGN